MQRTATLGLFVLTACGGGGGAAPVTQGITVTVPPATASPAGAPPSTATPMPNVLTGTLVSTDTDPPMPVSGATIVIGAVPIAGATVPPRLPAGDIAVRTDANGNFSAAVVIAPVAPKSEPFVVPPENLLGVNPPASGYYAGAFANGTDGVSGGSLLPLHAFIATGTRATLRVSSASPAEADALAAINRDRAANGASTLIFDATAESVARAHAADEGVNGYFCHYDLHNAGPASRYAAAGGLGLTGENLALVSGPEVAGFATAETAFLAEGFTLPAGAHYQNLIDTAHLWAGVAAASVASAPLFVEVDYELVTPNAIDLAGAATGYPVYAACPPGTQVISS